MLRSMMPNLITVGLTAFNAADTIERAFASALSQTWRPIEIIAVDDCSSDATIDILQSLASRNPELRVYRNSFNRGIAASRNKILAEAKGDFVAFFDDDDESLPDRLRQQWSRITDYEEEYANGAPVICHSARHVFYQDGSSRFQRTMGESQSVKAPYGNKVAYRILFGSPLKGAYGSCATCSQMARLSTYRMLGGFDESLRRSEDTEFNIRLALAGGHFVGNSVALVQQTMIRTSEKNLKEEHRNSVLILKKHRELAQKHGQYQFCLDWLDLKLFWQERRNWLFIVALSKLAVFYPWKTFYRIVLSIPNFGINAAFTRFHQSSHLF